MAGFDLTARVHDFVHELLWERWIDLDGSDLLIMDPTGGPLELTCSHQWDARVGRSCAPLVRQLAWPGLAWPEDNDEPADQSRVECPLPDLLIVDLAIAEEPLSLYDAAYGAFWSTYGQ
jgi:hypothetical protein